MYYLFLIFVLSVNIYLRLYRKCQKYGLNSLHCMLSYLSDTQKSQ